MTRLARLVRVVASLGVAAGLTLAAAVPVSAHATLISSDPGNGEVLARSPDHVQLQFDVPVNPRLSTVTMQDRAGAWLDGLAIDGASGVSNVLTVELPPLPQTGEYRLHFWARDDTDLHETVGEIAFGVGEPAVITDPPAVTPGPSYVETGSRWLELAGTCLLVGLVAVWLGILPAAARHRPVTRPAQARLLALATMGYAAIVLGKAGQLLVTVASLTSYSPDGWGGAVWTALTAGRFGMLWLVGMALAVLALIVVRGAISHAGWRPGGSALVLSVGALVAVSTLTSHGENTTGIDPVLVAIRIIHLSSAGLWVGGLSVLVVLYAGALRGGSPDGPTALAAFRRFTGLAFVAVGLLTSSGLLLAARGVESAAALITTPYGLTLLAKLIAGAGAVGLGVRHMLLLSPPRGAGVGGPVKLARSMPFEVGTMLLVLWGAAALGATAPAASAVSAAGSPLEADTMSLVDDLSVHSSMAPARQGANTLLVQVSGTKGRPTRTITRVVVRLTQPEQPVHTVVGRSMGGGRYEFPSVSVAAAGPLSAAVTIDRSDGTSDQTSCTWSMAPPPQAPPPGLPTTPWAPLLEAASGGLLLALAGGLCTWLVLSHRRRRTLAMGTAVDQIAKKSWRTRLITSSSPRAEPPGKRWNADNTKSDGS